MLARLIPPRKLVQAGCWASSALLALGSPACTRVSERPALPGAPGPPPIRLAVTIDDLPQSGESVSDWPKARILDALSEALHAQGVPSPVGFFVGGNLDDAPETRAALVRWVARGFRLANHTYLHSDANVLSVSDFLADVARDEQALDALLTQGRGKAPYFRFPFLNRGRPADRPAIAAYLASRGLRVADVSVDFEDWAYTDAFARCLARNDQPALQALSDDYLENAMAELFWADETTRAVLGRPLPQVLLVHATLITAQRLGTVLAAYRSAGVEFVSLEEALSDPVYEELENAQHGDVTLVEALLSARHASLRSFMPPAGKTLAEVCKAEP
jgi:peptidoglycan/xylan/chitin deacetylase (PgdA/CDA1 family)